MTDTPYLFNNLTVAASGNATSTTRIDCHDYTKINIYASNTGTSENCTIKIYGSPTLTSTMKKTIQPFTFGANDGDGVGIEGSSIPEFIWATVTNEDAANSAIVTVQLAMDR